MLYFAFLPPSGSAMSTLPEYDQLDGIALAQLIRSGQISRAEALTACMERIAAANPALNAVVRLMPEVAAAQIAAPLPDGPLAGVPVLLKDLLADVAGQPTSNGSRLFANYVPQQDAEIVRRYRQAGLVFAGKTATPEFGLLPVTEAEVFGPTRNPWDLQRTPGGSSGGAAAAVASGMVAIAHGGDGGGSIRIPASNCGLFGLKPSRGRSPFGPLLSEGWQGMVEQHALTRSVRDSAAMLDILCSADDANTVYTCARPGQSFLSALQTPGPRLRIAVCEQPFLGGTLDADNRAALQHSVALLQGLGHQVASARPALASAEQMQRAMLVMIAGELAALVRNAPQIIGRKAHWRDMEIDSWVMARYGELLSAGEFAWMRDFILAQGRIMHAFHADYDVLLTPVVNQLPAPVGSLATTPAQRHISRLLIGQFGWDWPLRASSLVEQESRRVMEYLGWTIPFNMSGQPAVSVPLYWNAQNIPVGTHLVARHGAESTLLQLSAELEQAQPWSQRRPPVAAGVY